MFASRPPWVIPFHGFECEYFLNSTDIFSPAHWLPSILACAQTLLLVFHSFKPRHVLWQAVPQAEDITKGCLSMPICPRLGPRIVKGQCRKT